MKNAGKIFAANLVRLMAVRPDLDTQLKVADKSGVAQSTVGRILRGTVSPTLENVEAIAHAFGKAPGEMIGSGYNSAAEIVYDRVRYAKLPKEEKLRVESYIEHALREHDVAAARGGREFNQTTRTPLKTSSNPQATGSNVFTKNEQATTAVRGSKPRKAS